MTAQAELLVWLAIAALALAAWRMARYADQLRRASQLAVLIHLADLMGGLIDHEERLIFARRAEQRNTRYRTGKRDNVLLPLRRRLEAAVLLHARADLVMQDHALLGDAAATIDAELSVEHYDD